jgi:hypothetical protein
LLEQDVFLLIALNLPLVGRMCFADVDDEEGDAIAEASMQVFKVPNLGTKRWSSEAAEDQRHRHVAMKGRQPYALVAAEAR